MNPAELSGTKSSIGGFSFLSVAEMGQTTLLMQYQSALREQLKLVTQKLEQVNSVKKGGVAEMRKIDKSVINPRRQSGPDSKESLESQVLRQHPATSVSSQSRMPKVGSQSISKPVEDGPLSTMGASSSPGQGIKRGRLSAAGASSSSSFGETVKKIAVSSSNDLSLPGETESTA